MGWDYCIASSNTFAVKDKASFNEWAEENDVEVFDRGGDYVAVQSEGGWPCLEDDDGQEIDIAEAIYEHLKGDSVAVLTESYTDRTGSSTTVVAINGKGERHEGECVGCVKTKAASLGTIQD